MSEKKYDLEDRTLVFSKNCIDVCRLLLKDTINNQIVGQLIRSVGSVGANYREANESISKKDFYHRVKICRKEAKESKYWLELLLHANEKYSAKILPLIDEALQLARIFGSIVNKQV